MSGIAGTIPRLAGRHADDDAAAGNDDNDDEQNSPNVVFMKSW